jgi:hypothetical protein
MREPIIIAGTHRAASSDKAAGRDPIVAGSLRERRLAVVFG